MSEEKKDEAKEPKAVKPKIVKPEGEKEAAPVQVQLRKLVIETDGTNVKITFDETSTLEKREIGRQLTEL